MNRLPRRRRHGAACAMKAPITACAAVVALAASLSVASPLHLANDTRLGTREAVEDFSCTAAQYCSEPCPDNSSSLPTRAPQATCAQRSSQLQPRPCVCVCCGRAQNSLDVNVDSRWLDCHHHHNHHHRRHRQHTQHHHHREHPPLGQRVVRLVSSLCLALYDHVHRKHDSLRDMHSTCWPHALASSSPAISDTHAHTHAGTQVQMSGSERSLMGNTSGEHQLHTSVVHMVEVVSQRYVQNCSSVRAKFACRPPPTHQPTTETTGTTYTRTHDSHART
jgi:hypothetical protein